MRIVVIGPHSTGKTTLVQDLSLALEEYGYVAPEKTYRECIEENGLVINQQTSKESQRIIRDFLFQQHLDNPQENIIFDRTVIDNYVYTFLAKGNGGINDEFIKETWVKTIKSFQYIDAFVYVPTSISVGVSGDGLRDVDSVFMDEVNELFLKVLFSSKDFTNAKLWFVSGSRKDRVNKVLKEMKKIKEVTV